MPNINRNNVDNWNTDIERSVDFYNEWFLNFAPDTYRKERRSAVKRVRKAFKTIADGLNLAPSNVDETPEILAILRQMTCPPLARDRLAGLAKVSTTVVKHFENGGKESPVCRWESILAVIKRLIDVDLLPWLAEGVQPKTTARRRAMLVVADRLCGALSDPVIRNEQEKRQFRAIADFLTAKGYSLATRTSFETMRPGEFSFHLNIPVRHGTQSGMMVNIPVDVAILPRTARQGDLPLMIEAKSAGDFTNVNKRRKEEAQKMMQLRNTYGSVVFILFLCGYFDSGYLGYEAAEGIDWIWEHRISDMEALGL